ncbi:MAG: hydrogenase iron-sulfur subunit [Planctomycetes bacterium]|nr:hydrogenase iron-sulfur subunit [Planctomycetota bacterium]
MSNQQSTDVTKVVVLYCQQAISEGAKSTDWAQDAEGINVQAIMLPCSSKVEVPYILRFLESGADAVEIVACPEKGCSFLIGSRRAEKRIEYVRGLLESIGDNPQRVGISRKLSQTPDELIAIAKARAEAANSN